MSTKAMALFKIKSVCKGGGYRYCRTEPAHPKANASGLYPLHRVIVENHIGRLLTSQEVVHHIDENKENDLIENLRIMRQHEHAKLHAKSVDPVNLICPVCGIEFQLQPAQYRARLRRNKSGAAFCSRSCGSTLP